MNRNIARYNTVVAEDHDDQYFFFRSMKARRIRAARIKYLKNPEKGAQGLLEATQLSFTYAPQRVGINYGACTKFSTEVSFLPNTLQLETQDCFQHRKEMQTAQLGS